MGGKLEGRPGNLSPSKAASQVEVEVAVPGSLIGPTDLPNEGGRTGGRSGVAFGNLSSSKYSSRDCRW